MILLSVLRPEAIYTVGVDVLGDPFIANFKTYVFTLPFDGKTYTVVDNTEIK